MGAKKNEAGGKATVFVESKGNFLQRMNNQHLMTFLKKKILLKGGNFEFQPKQERMERSFLIHSNRVSPSNQVLFPHQSVSSRREMEE